MTREEITQLNTDYLNDCESEHEMNELFYYALELQKHEQESSCPYYVIDEDGHGLCKNHRLEQEPKTWSLDDAREDFMSDVYNTLDFLPTNEEANRIIDSFDRVTNNIEQEPCDDIAQERYKDLCEYFGNAKDILKSREDFKAWLGRVKWHIRKAEELYEKYEYKQEPKTGHWIANAPQYDMLNPQYICSECGNAHTRTTPYCEMCGAKMVEPQESEEGMVYKLIQWFKRNPCKECDYYSPTNNVCHSKKCATCGCHPFVSWFDRHTLDEAIERYARNAEFERTHDNLQGCLEFRQLAEWLKELKQLREQTRWIPVSERLPNFADVYRVTRYYPNNVMNPEYLVDACFFDGSNTWYDDNRLNHERAYADNVIAWQENPEPYKPN